MKKCHLEEEDDEKEEKEVLHQHVNLVVKNFNKSGSKLRRRKYCNVAMCQFQQSSWQRDKRKTKKKRRPSPTSTPCIPNMSSPYPKMYILMEEPTMNYRG